MSNGAIQFVKDAAPSHVGGSGSANHGTSKTECKTGGWATSTLPVFRNQGDCVSYFATTKN